MSKPTGFWAARGKGALDIFVYTAISRKGIRRDANGDWGVGAMVLSFYEPYNNFRRWYGIALKPGEGPVRIEMRRGKP